MRALQTLSRADTPTRHRSTLHSYLVAMRPWHWVKNLLVFLPLLAAHLLAQASIAFVSFCLCASSVYLFNDLNDLAADRAHPQNRFRPLAAGEISASGALWAAAVLLVVSLTIGYTLGFLFVSVLCFYCVLMVIYSAGAKAIPILDVLMLACGYASRVVAGAVAAAVPGSPWLTAFCVFLFFSLALIKRYAELQSIPPPPEGGQPHARGYLYEDGTLLVAQGMAAGYLSVLVLALYTNTHLVQAPAGQYRLYWLDCLLLLYWVSHMWLMAHRGRIREDPVAYALKDPVSRILVAIAAVVTLLAV